MPDIVETAQLLVEITPKGIKEASVQLDELAKKAGITETKTKSLMDKFRDVQSVMQGPVAAYNQVKATIQAVISKTLELVDTYGTQERAVSNLEAVLKSTGNVLGLTSGELQGMASAMQSVTTFGDETVIQAQAVMATFKRIGKEVFPEAIKAAADLSTVMGMDLQSATVMIGKALNEPILGIGTLRRVGVQLTDQQEKMVKQFMSVNDVASAQAVIMGELKSQFGGAAETAGGKASASFKQLANVIGDVKEELGRALAEGLEPFNRALTESISKALSLGQSIRNIWGETKDAAKAKADIEAIIKLAETNRKEFERTYVRGQVGLNAEQVLALYKQRLAIVTAQAEEEERIARAAEEAARAKNGPEAQPWQLKLGEVTGVNAAGKTGAQAIDEYVQALMQGAELAVSFGDDIAATLNKVQSSIRATIEALLASGLFTESDLTVRTLRKHYEALGELAKGYSDALTPLSEFRDLTDEEIRARNAAAEASLRQQYATDERNRRLQAENELIKEAKERADAYAQALQNIRLALDQTMMNAYVEGFKAIGEGLVNGTLSAESFAEAMGQIGLELLNQLPLLFLSAGLQAIATGHIGIGLALIAASGLTAIGAGAANAASQASQNAHGNIFGWEGMQAFATGGAFTNKVASRATLFGYGGANLGIMGEKGPEAIMPLTRMPSGNLGVEAAVASQSVVVQIIDQTSGGVEKSTEETSGPNGEKLLKVILRDAVKSSAASGDLDNIFKSRYGLQPVGVRRS